MLKENVVKAHVVRRTKKDNDPSVVYKINTYKEKVLFGESTKLSLGSFILKVEEANSILETDDVLELNLEDFNIVERTGEAIDEQGNERSFSWNELIAK